MHVTVVRGEKWPEMRMNPKKSDGIQSKQKPKNER